MELKELTDAAVAQLKVDGKLAVQHQVELLFIPAANLALAKLKVAIPGDVDDAIIDLVGPKLIELLKEELDKLLAGI